MVVAAIGGAVWGYYAALGAGHIAWAAGHALATVFFSWAYTRELAPDDNPSAFVCVPIVAACWLFLGRNDLWLTAACLVYPRLVNRSVGPPAKIQDTVFLTLGLAAVTAYYGYVAIGMVGALAFLADALLRKPNRLHFGSAAIIGAATIYAVLTHGVARGHIPVWQIAVGAAPLALAIALQGQPESVDDVHGEPLDKSRLQVGMALGLLYTIGAALLASHISEVAVLFAASAVMLIAIIRSRR